MRTHPESEIAPMGNGLSPAQDGSVPEPLLRAFAPLHRTALGIACGVVGGGLLAIASLVLVLRGKDMLSLGLLGQFFPGYSVSWSGVLIGFLWGFGAGFALGYGFAFTRNAAVCLWLTVIRSRAEMDQYSDFLDHL